MCRNNHVITFGKKSLPLSFFFFFFFFLSFFSFFLFFALYLGGSLEGGKSFLFLLSFFLFSLKYFSFISIIYDSVISLGDSVFYSEPQPMCPPDAPVVNCAIDPCQVSECTVLNVTCRSVGSAAKLEWFIFRSDAVKLWRTTIFL